MNIRKTIKVNRERAIVLAMNHNCVPREIAEKYTDAELREVIKHVSDGAYTFKMIPNF